MSGKWGDDRAWLEERLWWEQSSAYWELPFYSDMGLNACEVGDFDDQLAGREQLFAIRELDEEPGEEKHDDEAGKAHRPSDRLA